jgi:gluconokinase
MGRADVVLAIDVGTSSIRVARFDGAGKRLPRSLVQRAHVLHTDQEGKAEILPDDLLGSVGEGIRAAAGRNPSVAAVGMSCFWHSLLGVDAAGNALTPVYTWADSRCRDDAQRLRGEFNERTIHARTGCMLRASFWPAKLRWLRRTQRGVFRRVRHWISPAEWLQWKLAGRAGCAIGMATGTGLFDPTKQAWCAAMLDACGISEEQLLPVSDAALEWKGAQWLPGIGDGAASNLGSGATSPGLGAINIGTSAALRVMSAGRTARAPFGLFCYRVDAERFLVGGAVSNAGNLRAWCLRELNLPADPARIEAALAARRTPDHGLDVLPFWNAERAPRWNEDDAGAILGMRQSTTALDLLQAITEAFHYRLANIADQITAARRAAPQWLVSGGVLRSRSALQRLADVLGQPVYASPEPEASLRGAAVFAIERTGGRVAPLAPGSPTRPDVKIHESHCAARRRQRRFEELLTCN